MKPETKKQLILYTTAFSIAGALPFVIAAAEVQAQNGQLGTTPNPIVTPGVVNPGGVNNLTGGVVQPLATGTPLPTQTPGLPTGMPTNAATGTVIPYPFTPTPPGWVPTPGVNPPATNPTGIGPSNLTTNPAGSGVGTGVNNSGTGTAPGTR